MDEDVLNPEVKMNREDYNDEKYWDYWSISSISSLTIEIQFPFSKNNATHVAQFMKGFVETFMKIEWFTMKNRKTTIVRRKMNKTQNNHKDGNNKRKTTL